MTDDTTVVATPPNTTTSRSKAAKIKALVRKAVANANAATLDDKRKYLELFDRNVELRGSGSVTDADSLEAYLVSVWSAYPESKVELDELICEGETAALRYTWHSGTEEAWLSYVGLSFLRLSDGKVVSSWHGVSTDAPPLASVVMTADEAEVDPVAGQPGR